MWCTMSISAGVGARGSESKGLSVRWRGRGPESAGVLGVGDGEVAVDVDAEGGARLSCVGRAGASGPAGAPGRDTRFIASICSLFSPIRRFA